MCDCVVHCSHTTNMVKPEKPVFGKPLRMPVGSRFEQAHQTQLGSYDEPGIRTKLCCWSVETAREYAVPQRPYFQGADSL